MSDPYLQEMLLREVLLAGPTTAVYIVGLVLGIVYYRKCPRPALLVIIAMSVTLLLRLCLPVLSTIGLELFIENDFVGSTCWGYSAAWCLWPT